VYDTTGRAEERFVWARGDPNVKRKELDVVCGKLEQLIYKTQLKFLGAGVAMWNHMPGKMLFCKWGEGGSCSEYSTGYLEDARKAQDIQREITDPLQ
jgi:hypothetical protein